MNALIQSLEAAEGGGVELSCDVGIALGEWAPPKGAVRDAISADVWRRDGLKYYHPYTECTTSLDAALALAERVLPGKRLLIFTDYGDGRPAAVVSGDVGPITTGRASTPALALCIAILRVWEGGQ